MGYWLGREFWGGGIATRALSGFLQIVEGRPLYAHLASHNTASLRVLEKCGFVISDEDREYSSARGGEIVWLILKLGARW